MKFWDSSALVPLLVEEPNSRECRDLYRVDPHVVAWQFTATEVASALAKLTRLSPPLGDGDLRTALVRLHAFLRRWEEVKALSDDALAEIRAHAERLMIEHVLHAGDALQLAAALVRFDRPMKRDFVVSDGLLARAAEAEGFRVIRLLPSRRR